MKLRFIGALGSVTGSCTLIEHQRRYYLVDCGATQGSDAIEGISPSFSFNPRNIKAVFLTHAHLDHCGLLPELARQGFSGDIICTRATADLTREALLDAARQTGTQFSDDDVNRLKFRCPDDEPGHHFGKRWLVAPNLTVSMLRTSHVLGAVGFAFNVSNLKGRRPSRQRTIVFSGDLGCNTEGNRYQSLMGPQASLPPECDFLVSESTYGGTVRDPRFACYAHRMEALEQLFQAASDQGPGATVIFPTFTLHRLQELLVDLHCVLESRQPERACTELPVEVVVDSPLAVKYGNIYQREMRRTQAGGMPAYQNPDLEHRLGESGDDLHTLLAALFGQWAGGADFNRYKLHFGVDDLNNNVGIRVVLAGSGMCNGGRVTEHLKQLLPDHRTTVALTGYQATGTPGAELRKRAINAGASIDGSAWGLSNASIKARVVDLSGFYSGHTDAGGLLDFLFCSPSGANRGRIRRVFLIHGDEAARHDLQKVIERRRDGPKQENDRVVGWVELPKADGRWFDLFRDKWVWEFHPEVEEPNQAIVCGLSRLQKLEVLLQGMCAQQASMDELDEAIDNMTLSRSFLASARVFGR